MKSLFLAAIVLALSSLGFAQNTPSTGLTGASGYNSSTGNSAGQPNGNNPANAAPTNGAMNTHDAGATTGSTTHSSEVHHTESMDNSDSQAGTSTSDRTVVKRKHMHRQTTTPSDSGNPNTQQ